MKYIIELKPSRVMDETEIEQLKEKVYSKLLNDIPINIDLENGINVKKCRQP